MAVEIKSYNQILGEMVRKIIADTPLNDVNTGSTLLTLLEAAAQIDFENNASILNVLELLNIDAIRNNDLDARAADFGLTRIPAQRATGFVNFSDSNISKRSTGLYQVKQAPIAGSNQIFVNNAIDWSATGTLFIGRGTANFEGPISYTSIVNNGSFFTINLASSLEKDHLVSEEVIDGQGTTDRRISSGTIVQVPANNLNPEIRYTTVRDCVIPAGEDTVENIEISAISAGAVSNAGINTIIQFASPPFSGATVTNTTALTNGTNVETDEKLRERIKSYSNTLARGTKAAILSSVIGVSDSEDGKQVASAVITEPPKVGDPSILYIDDGSGFQPSYAGQSVDILLNEASGNEEFLQLANFPLPRPQVVNTVSGPYQLVDQMELRVVVDGAEESIIFTENLFSNISAATISEIIIAINNQSSTFKAIFTENSSKILLFPVDHAAETIQVSPISSNDNETLFANNILKFPTNEFSYIRLYKNNVLLTEKEIAATLLTTTFLTWNITSQGNLIISVDGTPPQDMLFTLSDFNNAPFTTLTEEDWATVFNKKFAGLTASTTSSGRLQLVSNREGGDSSLEVLGGSLFTQLFAGQDTTAVGKNSDFQLNRQNGNLRILTEINPGDAITAGISDAKGAAFSSVTLTGSYNVSTDASGRPADLVVIADSPKVDLRLGIGLAIGNQITVTSEPNDVMRLTSDSVSSFAAIVPGDILFIASRGLTSSWINPANTGVFKIVAKGDHVNPGTDTYVEVKNVNTVPGVHIVEASEDIQAFRASSYPQLWKGTFVTTPALTTLQELVDSFNSNIINVNSTIFKTSSLKLTSTTEEGGSISTPAGSGNAVALFPLLSQQEGTSSFIANKTPDKDFVSFFKRTIPTSTDAEGVTGKSVFLGRSQYTDIKGEFTSSVEPGEEGVDTYSEELSSTGVLTLANLSYDDTINYLDGSNKWHYRSIRDYLPGDTVGTQHALPRTIMDISSGEKFNLMRPTAISSEDGIVFILDQDSIAKTIDIRMSRTGQINSDFPTTTFSFSGNDANNEPGITFGNLQVWGTNTNNTNFQDYAVWFRARNWYTSGGSGSGGGSFMVRSVEYGPHGESTRFRIEYPELPDLANTVNHANNPDFSLVTYKFGSGPVKPVGLADGNTFTVTSLGGDVYRYTFNNSPAFASVLPLDVISILSGSGVSAANSGQFSILNVDDFGKTIDIYNPNGVASIVGNPEVTTIDTISDVVGSPTISVVSNMTAAAGLDGETFTLYDTSGSVAVYYNVGTPAPLPPILGVDRIIEVVLTGAESATTVASLTSGALTADLAFSSVPSGNSITVTAATNGPLSVAIDGTPSTGFTFAGTPGTPDVSIDGRYFTLQDQNGSVAFWYDVSGLTSEPLHGADRSVEITTVNAGDSAATVATKTAVVIAGDIEFASATTVSNQITVTDAENGVRPAALVGTSGFTIAQSIAGVDTTVETINLANKITIFPLENTSVADIVSKISENPLLIAAEIDGTNDIVKATREEVYTPAGIGDYSVSLSHGHDPDPLSGENGFVRLFDSIGWVKDFQNLNPHFTLKNELILPGSSPASYEMETTPNEDSTTGEYFRLVPVTLENVYHHFTQKALSQLPIVADIDIADNIRRIQIKSKLLGSSGAVEVVGGSANSIDFSIFGEGQITPGTESGQDFLEIKTRAFPVTLTKGALVEIENTKSTKRLSRLSTNDTIDVVNSSGDNFQYTWNQKDTKLTSLVRFTITDVSSSYGRPAGIVWRWQHTDSGSFYNILDKTLNSPLAPPDDLQANDPAADAANLEIDLVQAGDMSNAQNFRLTVAGTPAHGDHFVFESASGSTFAIWFALDGNMTLPTGTQFTAATNKIQVDILSSDSEDQIITKMAAVLNVNGPFLSEFIGEQEEGANLDDVVEGDLLNAYGSFPVAWDSGNTANPNGNGNIAGFPIIAVDSLNRHVDVLNPKGVEMLTEEAIGTGAVEITPTPIIKWNLTHNSINDVSPTRYKIESIGFNNLYRLVWVDGAEPQFVDCGVAVDDLMSISGTTFGSINSGIFRVLGVDNRSVIFQNEIAQEELNTLIPFNNSGIPVNWTANLDLVTGVAGAFENLEQGDWVKKPEDDDSKYKQVVGFFIGVTPATPATATSIQLGSNYEGATSTGLGLSFDQSQDVGKGNYLQDIEDIKFYEGDSVRVGDRLFVDSIANTDWFTVNNSGTHDILVFGTDSSYRPFIQISNPGGQAQTARRINVAPLGFFILEGDDYRYKSIRQIEHTAIDSFNTSRRAVYMTPPTKVDKISISNGTKITPIGKLGYAKDVTTGVDGYSYYTGLMRTVQRIIDGFEPESSAYPGSRAVGGAIESLPPLIRRVLVSVEVTTNEGVNLNEISNDIKTAVINYVDSLGVGEDVILSEITVAIMDITGVAAVTFNDPTPSTERISIADNEKAFIQPNDISVA